MNLPPIHVLGTGNLGKFLAHALIKRRPSAPVTFIMHRPDLIQDWERADRTVEVVDNFGKSDRQKGFLAENTLQSEVAPHIKHLIIATKASATLRALKVIASRLSQESTVLFVQNGMGTIDEVSESIFKSASRKPRTLTGIVSHGVYKNQQSSFSIVHASQGSITLGEHPLSRPHILDTSAAKESSDTTVTSPPYLFERLCESAVLDALVVSPKELLLKQLEKLVINAVINPLTVIFNCRNGILLEHASTRALMKALVIENSAILQGIVRSSPASVMMTDVDLERFSPQTLWSQTVHKTALIVRQNISSMLQDVRAGSPTEIDYINGYLVVQADRQGIEHSLNRQLVEMVKKVRVIPIGETEKWFPTVDSGSIQDS